ncbi:tRNA (N6-threonylcarbamoyladenosine(37)-N6)-methyltransferase TrmO [Actomonas aquatica]|uniref:tRNA (N6-threonylcarbamoyladenosine(37)-N6)-methyltransferase TrmO n=1 Tax=Actomonas aquatica TaxID=2866162 RepID=A0ABZ1C6J4_9BACT|nr:tRNA (N6-threonylcarbamoyladenosine(37)-N6)-methyltransferase TrmO [Opitutus sp. WL0086]WRQ85935.1 tRNA (N6-threonylcarbamoyladenosine(37)-N6)-methyltransferase TrmO [Opitutus sp. WL0086]
MTPVAHLRTPFAEKFGVPRQSGIIGAAEGRVEFLPAFASPDFVRGLEAFSHVWLITGFHKNPAWDGAATVRPPRLGGNERVGVFASRAPLRPNGLGLSLVELRAIEPGALRVGGIDCVDGTPVYDIKPYLPWCEAKPEARADWAGSAPNVRTPDAVRLSEDVAAVLPAAVATLARQVLTLDLQPAYQKGPAATERTYGVTLAGWNLRWHPTPDNGIEVFAAEAVETA